MVSVSNIYNHLGTTLVPVKRNTTHKSSELKEVYANMARYNRKSPLYLLSLSDSKQEQIINIKEAALTLREVSDAFSNEDSNVYTEKVLYSDNEDCITGSFKKQATDNLPDKLEIQVDSLATEQVNTGNYIDSSDRSLAPGNYSFSLQTANSSSRFNLTVTPEDTNLDVQNRLLQYINNRNLGVKGSLIQTDGKSALMYMSAETGRPNTEDGLFFSFEADDSGNTLIDALGLNNVSTQPDNSRFRINGDAHSSSSNQISINQTIELDFHKTSNSPVTISFIPDKTNAINNINMFVNAYNSLVDISETSKSNNPGSRNLYNDISAIVDKHKSELEAAGLSIDESNKILTDDALITSGVESGSIYKLFTGITSFKDDITNTTQRLSIDPIAYINKLIVTYPNTNQKVGSVYNQSLYSGLMYNNYA